MSEYVLLILYFSAFICLCAMVCLYFSGCQEMTYKHDGEWRRGVLQMSLATARPTNKQKRPSLIGNDLADCP